MNEDDFRSIALRMPGAVERSHMGHPDFRTGEKGRVFATLSDDDDGPFGVVMLTPDEQAAFIAEAPGTFEPVKGKWGEGGATRVRLADAARAITRRAVMAAWRGKGGAGQPKG